MDNYTSSIIFKYGDNDNLKQDVKTLNEILSRQGNALFIDVMSENFGQLVLKYKLNKQGTETLKESLLIDLSDALNERT